MPDIEAFIAGLNELTRQHDIAIHGDYNGLYLRNTDSGEKLACGPRWLGDQYEWYGMNQDTEPLRVKPVSADAQ